MSTIQRILNRGTGAGGANTNKNGLGFEKRFEDDLATYLLKHDYKYNHSATDRQVVDQQVDDQRLKEEWHGIRREKDYIPFLERETEYGHFNINMKVFPNKNGRQPHYGIQYLKHKIEHFNSDGAYLQNPDTIITAEIKFKDGTCETHIFLNEQKFQQTDGSATMDKIMSQTHYKNEYKRAFPNCVVDVSVSLDGPLFEKKWDNNSKCVFAQRILDENNIRVFKHWERSSAKCFCKYVFKSIKKHLLQNHPKYFHAVGFGHWALVALPPPHPHTHHTHTGTSSTAASMQRWSGSPPTTMRW
jgi:hypothetical protein